MATPRTQNAEIVVKKQYILTQKQIKKILNTEGDIITMGLWKGLSPNDEAQGKSMDLQEFIIDVVEKRKIKYP
ncbi:MAG: hypothetical protein PHH26_00445 [Candidatus Thermoplasmatota archaeon]|nr:hypothetical protein [Candidatus Thermoplasmatota archaeon]